MIHKSRGKIPYSQLSKWDKFLEFKDIHFCKVERPCALIYLKALWLNNTSVLEDYERFGDRLYSILMNKRGYDQALMFGYDKIEFDGNGWIIEPKFSDFEKFDFPIKNRVILNYVEVACLNGKWVHGVSTSSNNSGMGSSVSIWRDAFNTKEEAIIDGLNIFIEWHKDHKNEADSKTSIKMATEKLKEYSLKTTIKTMEEKLVTEEVQKTEETKFEVLKINQVNAFNTTQEVIDELKADYSALVIAGVEDKSGYKVAKAGKAKCVTLRNAIEKRRKSLKNDVDKVGKALLDDIAKAETNLDKQIKKIDDANAKAVQDEKLAAEKQFKDRTDKLFALGTGYNGAVYQLGTAYITPSELQTMSDEFFTTTLGKFEAAAKVISDKVAADLAATEALAEREKQLAEKEAEINKKLDELKLLQNPDGQAQQTGLDNMVKNDLIQSGTVIGLTEKELTIEIVPKTPVVNVTGFFAVNGGNQTLNAGDPVKVMGENKAADMLGNMKAIESIIVEGKVSAEAIDSTKEIVTTVVAAKTTEELHAEIFEQGFKACQDKLILIVADKTRTLTRPILIETITNLKP